MIAYFGCHAGMQWNLCEENAVSAQFSVSQLRAMADWIMLWDGYCDHPIAVHANGNDATLYTSIISDLVSNPPPVTTYAPWRNHPWLDVTSYYIYDDAPQTLGSTAPSGVQLGFPPGTTPRTGYEYNFDCKTEQLRGLLDTTPVGRRVVLAVDEPGEWMWGAAGTNDQTVLGTAEDAPTLISSPDGKRRGTLYDILFSGGTLEWYFGYGMEADGFARTPPNYPRSSNEDFGGGDVSADEFRSREDLWRATKAARDIMKLVPFWAASPNDSLVLGEFDDGGISGFGTGVFGQAQVYGTTTGSPATGGFYLIYYPSAYDAQGIARSLGQLQIPGPIASTTIAVAQFYSPLNGQEISPQTPTFYANLSSPIPLNAPPASSFPGLAQRGDLVCLVTLSNSGIE